MFLERLAQAAAEKCGLRQDEPILLGVSGGADSLAMAFGLDALGYPLVIGHVDHALRPESKNEAKYVRELAADRGWPFTSQRIDVHKFAEAEGQSIEEAARQVRYQFLFEQARVHNCQAVAVAHHADDQVETVLMHFLRGTGLSGLTGMSYQRIMPVWDPDIPLVRPLLGFWREDIEQFIKELGILPCVDLTNLDTTYFRNRLRHALIPELESYNPQIKAAVLRMADVLGEEADWLNALTSEGYQACLLTATEHHVEISLPKFLGFSIALKRRVLRRAIEQLRPDLRDIGYEALTRGLSFCERAKPGDQVDLIARLNLAVVKDVLIVKTWTAKLPDFDQPLLISSTFTGELGLDQTVMLRQGWQLEACLIKEMPESPLLVVKNLPSTEAWLDYDCLNMPLAVRGLREGERFQPIGMQGQSQSLQDFFINLKLPAHMRPLWPLLVSGDRIAWVVGLRPAEEFKITPKTQRILKLNLNRRDDTSRLG